MAKNIKASLADILGLEYLRSVSAANEFLGGLSAAESMALAQKQVDFFPDSFAKKQDELLEMVGKQVAPPLNQSSRGAATDAFANALHKNMAPVAASGLFRIGEDGRLYLAAKSEHYQASLGHAFPGYELLKIAEKIGISNITHNNTRGHITRMMEQELVRIANGIKCGDDKALSDIINGNDPKDLCRVINLETGSLAMEAAVKMMLARFYRLHKTSPAPKYFGKTPVLLVMADHAGGMEANYHGTAMPTQLLRGMWPELYARASMGHCMKVRQVKINDIEDFRKAVADSEQGEYKPAGFLHELVLMNYGGIKLDYDYIREAHKLCLEHDIPTAVDEIQTGIWSPEIFLFKEYGVKPSFVSVGKGFPGGMYPASRLICCREMDNLDLFGALVTNGQEEIASLAYLVTMGFAEANAQETRSLGEYFHKRLNDLARKHANSIKAIEGEGLLRAIRFEDAGKAALLATVMNKNYCIDISAQTYKANCPPTALLKLPLISSTRTMDFLADKLDAALTSLF